MAEETFPNAPLVEAVFQIHFDGKLSIDSNKHLFQEAISNELPILQVGTPKIPTNHNLIPYRLTNKDESELVQFSINTFAYHSKRYPGFAEFSKRCLKFCELFDKTFSLDALKSTGLRYIDHIPVLREAGVVPLQKYLNFGYKLPTGMPEKLEKFSTKIVSQIDSGKLSTTIELIALEDAAQTELIVLDFDYIKVAPLNMSNLSTYLTDSHSHTKKLFMNFISEEYKAVMRKVKGK